jgi:hypothetical protein
MLTTNQYRGLLAERNASPSSVWSPSPDLHVRDSDVEIVDRTSMLAAVRMGEFVAGQEERSAADLEAEADAWDAAASRPGTFSNSAMFARRAAKLNARADAMRKAGE